MASSFALLNNTIGDGGEFTAGPGVVCLFTMANAKHFPGAGCTMVWVFMLRDLGRVSFDLYLFRKRVSGRVMHVSNLALERNDFQPNRAGSWMFHCYLKKMAACASCMLARPGGLNVQGAHKAIYLELQWGYSTTYLEEPAHPRTGVGELFPLPKLVEGLPE